MLEISILILLKRFILVFCLLFAIRAHTLEVKWLGVACAYISDGKTSLVFDPVPTKPGLQHWFLNQTLKSDPEQVSKMLKESDMKNVKAVFVSHTHFDHATDASVIAEQLHAPIFGGPSLQKIANAHVPHPEFIPLIPDNPVHIGKFKITGIRRQHAPILSLFQFLDGPVPEDFVFRFYQYHAGETWNYFIEHPDGNILFDQGGRLHEPNRKYQGRIKTLIAGAANRRSADDWVDNSVLALKPSHVIPIHFDCFFLQSEWLEKKRLPGIGLEKLEALLKEKSPSTKWTTPIQYKSIEL